MRRVLAALCIAVLVASAAGAATVTLQDAVTQLRNWLIHGGGTGDPQGTWDGFWKALNGDMTMTITFEDQTPDSMDHYTDWSQTVRIAFTDASGDVNGWFSGNASIKLSEDVVSGSINLSNSGDAVALTNGYVDLTLSGTDTEPVHGDSIFIIASIDKFRPFGVSQDYCIPKHQAGWLYKTYETIVQ